MPFFHAEKKQSFELNHACTLYIMCFVSEPLVFRNALLCSGNKQLLCYNTARHPLSLPLPSLSAGPALREESQKKTAEKKKRPAALKRQREKKQQPTTPASLALVMRTASLKSNKSKSAALLTRAYRELRTSQTGPPGLGVRPSACVSSGSSPGTLTHLITSERAAFH